MPTVRYPVADEFVVRAGNQVDWGTPISYDEMRGWHIYETEVESDQDARRLRSAYVEGGVMPSINTGSYSSNTVRWDVHWNSPAWNDYRVTTTPAHYQEYRRYVPNAPWMWTSTTSESTQFTYDTEWVRATWDDWTSEYRYHIVNEDNGASRTIVSSRPLTPDELPRTNERDPEHPERRMRPPEIDPEVRVAREQARLAEYRQREATRRERAEREREEREQAHARSLELLRIVLSAAEHEHYEQEDQIIITGSAGTRYLVEQNGYEGNVSMIDEDGVVYARLCAHPQMYQDGNRLPPGDAWVAQVLALKTDEDNFLRTANIHWSNRDDVHDRRRALIHASNQEREATHLERLAQQEAVNVLRVGAMAV